MRVSTDSRQRQVNACVLYTRTLSIHYNNSARLSFRQVVARFFLFCYETERTTAYRADNFKSFKHGSYVTLNNFKSSVTKLFMIYLISGFISESKISVNMHILDKADFIYLFFSWKYSRRIQWHWNLMHILKTFVVSAWTIFSYEISQILSFIHVYISHRLQNYISFS